MSNYFYLMIKEFIKKEYTLRSEVLTNISIHIDDMNRDNIIHHNNRNKMMSIASSCVTALNTAYNNTLRVYKTIDYDITNEERQIIDTGDIEGFIEFITYFGKDSCNIQKKISEYFADIDKEIYNLMESIGSKKISDIFKIDIGYKYDELMGIEADVKEMERFIQNNKKDMGLMGYMIKLHNTAALISILDKYFIPVEIKTIKKPNNKTTTTVLINRYKYDGVVNSEESTKFKYEIMLDNCYKVTIKCGRTNKTYVIYGYFDYDVINSIVATSQISNSIIHQKKRLLIEYARENISINKEYRDAYLSNMTLGDILSFKGDALISKMLSDFDLYCKTCNIKFKVTVTDFLKSDLSRKFNILRCLLLGPKNSIKNAAMLFGMTKDQNRESKNNKTCVADILFRNLNYAQQSRLRKSGQYIKQELDRLKKLTLDDTDLKQQCLLNNNMSDYVKKCVLTRLDELKTNNSEYHKNLTYVKTLIDYPWIPEDYQDIFTTNGGDLAKCREKLKQVKEEFDTRVFGQTEFKTVIGDIVGKWFTNPNSMGKAIGLCGPPGCGKTLIASGLGKVLDIPYQEIHLGGLEDGSVLNGHSFTYSGAQPGLIISRMVAAGEPRCILFFDELDKACTKHGVNEVFNVLIHATDPNTNSRFNDKFFQDVTFPLNKCIFVFSFNDASKIDPILKDRMEIINVSPYSLTDKLTIAKNYLTPELLDSVCIERGTIQLSPAVYEYIISKYTLEAGVRKLRSCIEKVFLKLNVDRIHERGPYKNNKSYSATNPIKLTQKQIVNYLGKPNITIEKIHTTNQIGVINGLYATTIGSGGIIPILVYPAKNDSNKTSLELTGKQGKVMRESVNFAWTIAKNCTKHQIVQNFHKTNRGGIHVHTPDGAVPKDGPSAGSAFTTAFISRLTGFPIKRDIAMTGEISVGGNITAIGGLEYKLTGAKLAGVKLVFVCEQNLDDLKKIKETNPNLFSILNVYNNDNVKKVISSKSGRLVNTDFKIIVVNTIYDIIPYALMDPVYITQNYTDKNLSFTVYDQTCDWNTIMIKNDGGFGNSSNSNMGQIHINAQTQNDNGDNTDDSVEDNDILEDNENNEDNNDEDNEDTESESDEEHVNESTQGYIDESSEMDEIENTDDSNDLS